MLIKEQALLSFLQRCADGSVGAFSEIIVPVQTDTEVDQFKLGLLSENTVCRLDGHRSVDPVKILFYMPREKVLPAQKYTPKRLIAGVKACDLKAVEILDLALTGANFVDPVYKEWRKETWIISADCTSAAPTCHCTLVEGKPYAGSGYDLNLSKLGDSFVVQAGSQKGVTLLDLIRKHTENRASGDADLRRVQSNREKLFKQVISQNRLLERSGKYARLLKDRDTKWPQVSETCVGCGACTHICPTCYCLILNDETKTRQFIKVRSYDSCQLHGYARVAGGASPRPKMHQRFRNRYLCKFLYMKNDFGQLGCTGCGRCTEACAGNIDFRKVVRRITANKSMDVVD
jgi:sulfhydrogenase subunit beta (sulfur reductase)